MGSPAHGLRRRALAGDVLRDRPGALDGRRLGVGAGAVDGGTASGGGDARAAIMSLMLTYEGPLPSRNAKSANAAKNSLRRAFHPQLLQYCNEDNRFWLVRTI